MRFAILLFLLLSIYSLVAQRGYEIDLTLRMDWEDYDPPSTLVVPENPVSQARFPFRDVHSHHWRMYGLDLPDEILQKLYYKNALRIIPGLDASLFPE